MRLELDYNIITAEERCQAIVKLEEEGTLGKVSNRELEKAANYILYGKTPKGNPLPEAKQITTKHSTWKKKAPESLDSLMENLIFDETTLKPMTKRSPYTNPKPTISRTKDATIPGMAQLWEDIAKIEEVVAEEKEKNGKSLRTYYLNHLLIDLRKEQYHLKDIFKPTLHFMATQSIEPHEVDWNTDSGFAVEPLTVHFEPNGALVYDGPAEWTWHTVAEHTIDLTNPTHIYNILNLYSSLKHQAHETPMSHTACLLLAIENLVDRTELSPIRYHILIRKIDHASNEDIVKELEEFFEVSYATNYISTIWTKEICKAIAKTGQIDIDEWDARKKPHLWKTCAKCQRKKLRDIRFFARRRNTHDLLSPTCKTCEK